MHLKPTMRKIIQFFFIIIFLFTGISSQGQTDSLPLTNDSLINAKFHEYYKKLADIEELRVLDSIKKTQLELELQALKSTDNIKKEELQNQLKDIENSEKSRLQNKKNKISRDFYACDSPVGRIFP